MELSENKYWKEIKESPLSKIPATIVIEEDFKHLMKKLEIPGVTELYDIFRDCRRISFEFHAKRDYMQAAELCQKIVTALKEPNILTLELLSERLSEIDFNERLMHGFLRTISSDVEENIFTSEAYFLSACTGGKYLELTKKILDTGNSTLLLLMKYAIKQNKKAFLRLLDEETELFNHLPNRSILYMTDFWNCCNLNALSKKNIELLLKKDNKGYVYTMHNCKIKILAEKQRTFNEIITVGVQDHKIQEIYSFLDDSLGVDEKLRRIRQLFHETMEWENFASEDSQFAAKALSRIPLMDYREQWKAFDLSIWDSFCLLVMKEKDPLVKGLLKEVTDANDIQIILNNPGNIDLHRLGITRFKENFVDLDANSHWLEGVIHTEKEPFRDFCLQGNATIVRKYYDSVDYEQQRKNVLLIAKAAACGKLEAVKYQNFSAEIGYTLPLEQKQLWKENLSIRKKEMSVAEYSDFYSCMTMGEVPQHTCMSYISGVYNECLLSIFDANKKVLYVKESGKIVGRAILRITKMSKDVKKLGFEDVENTEESTEKLAIFLEKSYVNGISGESFRKIQHMLFALAKKKADILGAKLLIAENYSELAGQLKRLTTNVYISRSKNGKQYLDSLGGNCEQGGYFKRGNFYTI